eukprot:UN3712
MVERITVGYACRVCTGSDSAPLEFPRRHPRRWKPERVASGQAAEERLPAVEQACDARPPFGRGHQRAVPWIPLSDRSVARAAQQRRVRCQEARDPVALTHTETHTHTHTHKHKQCP